MAGIYIHIPFCKQACHYCNFHFSTGLQKKNDFLDALFQEIVLRKDFLNEKIETIYFGGGTPSLLTSDEISKILTAIYQHFDVINFPEITLEANPDDLNTSTIKAIKSTSINRLSIGIQSFYDDDLDILNRAHNSSQAEKAIQISQNVGFENITIDLIYGIQTLTDEKWRANLEKAISFNIPHISSYCLTVEPKTVLAHFIKKGEIKNVDEVKSARQFEILMSQLQIHGYQHYEISNFAKTGFESNHNSSYWTGKKYLGLGPSAHSFNGVSRQWNIANNIKYINGLKDNNLTSEEEILTENNRMNETIMISLRTMNGIDLKNFETKFGSMYKNVLTKSAATFIKSGHINQQKNRLTLSQKGKLLADHIISELFVVD